MKRSKIIFGAALMGIAFTTAAFTAEQATLANDYIEKPGECKQIHDTQCEPNQPVQCEEEDGGVPYPVFQSPDSSDPTQCQTPLGLPE